MWTIDLSTLVIFPSANCSMTGVYHSLRPGRCGAEAALQDCGEVALPSGIVCYEGQLLVETFKVKVTNSDGTTGSLDMQVRLDGEPDYIL